MQFTKTKIKTYLYKEKIIKHIYFFNITAFMIFSLLLLITIIILKNNIEVKKVQAKNLKKEVFSYSLEAKKNDLEAIKQNHINYINKIAKKQAKIKHIKNFNINNNKIQAKEKIKAYNSNIWSDKKVIRYAIQYLKKKEWVRYKAYPDFKQYSICYGIRSKKWATATYRECQKQLKDRVQSELLKINRIADNLEGYKKVALISFFYNTWYNIKVLRYASKWDVRSVIFLMNKYQYAGGKFRKNLHKRRLEEIKIYKWLYKF